MAYEIYIKKKKKRPFAWTTWQNHLFDLNVMFKNFQVLYAMDQWSLTIYGVINFILNKCQTLRTVSPESACSYKIVPYFLGVKPTLHILEQENCPPPCPPLPPLVSLPPSPSCLRYKPRSRIILDCSLPFVPHPAHHKGLSNSTPKYLTSPSISLWSYCHHLRPSHLHVFSVRW